MNNLTQVLDLVQILNLNHNFSFLRKIQHFQSHFVKRKKENEKKREVQLG